MTAVSQNGSALEHAIEELKGEYSRDSDDGSVIADMGVPWSIGSEEPEGRPRDSDGGSVRQGWVLPVSVTTTRNFL